MRAMLDDLHRYGASRDPDMTLAAMLAHTNRQLQKVARHVNEATMGVKGFTECFDRFSGRSRSR